jgi:hypothetical protein
MKAVLVIGDQPQDLASGQLALQLTASSLRHLPYLLSEPRKTSALGRFVTLRQGKYAGDGGLSTSG